uniref:PPIase cyclophilin-type domain-containing protein n=1 Tax=Pseudo-nitzschia australis TaxID=44445 RepID=A0A7S4EPP0_9STRA
MLLAGLLLVTMGFVVWQILIIEGTIVLSSDFTGITNRVGSDSETDLHNARHSSHSYRAGAVAVAVAFDQKNPITHEKESKLRAERVNKQHRPAITSAIFDESQWEERNKHIASMNGVVQNACGYKTGLKNLTQEQLYPVAGERHMITPPKGGKLSLVCCETTKGNLAMVAHHKWAPIGAKHFIEMVTSKYFDSTVPMMRCIKGFLCQFGLNSDPKVTKKFNKSLKDDPNWLPEGPKFRTNADGVQRFAQGYLAYAGAGKNSRGNQLIVSLKANGPLAGGSPWEVPWGELVGKDSFVTLSKIYTGYGEDGPGQGPLQNRGMDEKLKEKFPDLDYINKCVLVDEMET